MIDAQNPLCSQKLAMPRIICTIDPRQMWSVLLRFDPEHHFTLDPFVISDWTVGISLVDADGRYWGSMGVSFCA